MSLSVEDVDIEHHANRLKELRKEQTRLKAELRKVQEIEDDLLAHCFLLTAL